MLLRFLISFTSRSRDTIRGLHRQTPEFLTNDIYQMPLLLALAALIADCAACLASGLAGCLALAAAALFQSVLKILCVQALYMFHGFRSSLFIWCTVYHKYCHRTRCDILLFHSSPVPDALFLTDRLKVKMYHGSNRSKSGPKEKYRL